MHLKKAVRTFLALTRKIFSQLFHRAHAVDSTVAVVSKVSKKSMLSSIKHLRVGHKIGVGYTVITAIIFLVAITSMYNFEQISKQNKLLNQVKISEDQMQEAKIALEHYKSEKTRENAELVYTYLNEAISIINGLGSKLHSKVLTDDIEAFDLQLHQFYEEYTRYLSLEKAKADQSRVEMSMASNVASDIRRAMDGAQFQITLADDLEKIPASFEQYATIQKGMEAFSDVRIAGTKYAFTESESYLETLKINTMKAKEYLTDIMNVSQSTSIKDNLGIALKSLEQYEMTFDKYEGMIQEQRGQMENMRIAIETTSQIATLISDEVMLNTQEIIQNANHIAVSALVFGMVLSIVIAIGLTTSLTKPLKAIVSQMALIAAYDLTHPIDVKILTRSDEMGVLAKQSEDIRNSLLKIIIEISKASSGVSSTSKQLTDTGSMALEVGREVSLSVEEITYRANTQADSTENGAREIAYLGELIERDLQQVKSLAEFAMHIEDLKDEGMEILDHLVNETKFSSQATDSVQVIVEETNASAMKIENASSLIADIAKQTNLLALNAAIEAARAGEAGRGFAVVADEVRKLAEQTNQFTSEINNDIYDLKMKSSEAVKTMKKAKAAVGRQENDVHRTSEKYKGIAKAIGSIRENVDVIHTSGIEMSSQMGSIKQLIISLSDTSKSNAVGSAQATIDIKEQSEVIDDISVHSKKLSRLAQTMDETVTLFKIN